MMRPTPGTWLWASPFTGCIHHTQQKVPRWGHLKNISCSARSRQDSGPNNFQQITSLLRATIATACISKRPLYACYVDLPKAYNTVQHHLLWDKLESIGVRHQMLAAMDQMDQISQSEWDTLREGSWPPCGIAGHPRLQQMGVHQGCPVSPMLFGLFVDGLHDVMIMTTCSPLLQLQKFSSDLANGSQPWCTLMMWSCCHDSICMIMVGIRAAAVIG